MSLKLNIWQTLKMSVLVKRINSLIRAAGRLDYTEVSQGQTLEKTWALKPTTRGVVITHGNETVATAIDNYPVGFVYAQFPDCESPISMDLSGVWEDITQTFNRCFFRVEGGPAYRFDHGEQPSCFPVDKLSVSVDPGHTHSSTISHNHDLQPTGGVVITDIKYSFKTAGDVWRLPSSGERGVVVTRSAVPVDAGQELRYDNLPMKMGFWNAHQPNATPDWGSNNALLEWVAILSNSSYINAYMGGEYTYYWGTDGWPGFREPHLTGTHHNHYRLEHNEAAHTVSGEALHTHRVLSAQSDETRPAYIEVIIWERVS